MSTPEAPIPKKFWAMVHWTIQNHPWIFFLVAVERMAEHDFRLGAVFAAIFVANLFVASRWEEIGGYLQRRKSMLPYLALGALGILFLGIAIGALWSRQGSFPLGPSGSTGRITWNFDQPAESYFLAMTSLNNEEIRIAGFQAHGKNTSSDPITEFSGFIRSDLTNAERPILLNAQEPTKDPNIPPFVPQPMIPTDPKETYGIPGLAEFDIITHDKPYIETGKDGITVEEFLRTFGPFTLILQYDGMKLERHFSREQIKAQIALLEKLSSLQGTSVPRVTRKPTAKAVQMFPTIALPSPSETTHK